MSIDFSKLLPPMLFGSELSEAMTCLPEYDSSVRTLPASERLMRLTDIYRVFVPTSMTTEIYHKLYMMVAMSLRQKGNIQSIQQLNANYRWSHGGEFHGVATGATSATIIGNSGIGKTSSIQYAVDLLGPIITIDKPLHKVIPVVMVSCPFDSNYRGLLCQILMSIDESLGTNYYEHSEKSRMNAQQILGLVCQVCHLYIGVLIIDEIQFLVEHKAGTQLYRMILQLINASGINVLLVGTNECIDFFEQAPQMARRAVGLQYGALEYGSDFRKICETLFHYQYTEKGGVLTDGLCSWLYEHTGGVSSSLVSLVHDAQEIAILRCKECLNVDTLTEAYNNRMRMLHPYIATTARKLKQTSSIKAPVPAIPLPKAPSQQQESKAPSPILDTSYRRISDIISEAKVNNSDIVESLRKYVTVEEVLL